MAELFAEDYGVYGEAVVYAQIVFPMDGFDLLVYFIGILGCKVLDRLQNADGGTQAEVGLVHHFFVSTEGYHTASYLNVIGS